MSNFQAQGQWENEQIPEIDEGNKPISTRNNGNKKIYIIIGIVFVTVVLGILAVYHYARPIEGIWLRQADDHIGAEGMTVEVVKTGSLYEGKVITGSDDPTKFKAGQIKWFEIRKVGFGIYECYDLCEDEENGAFYYDGTISTIKVLPGGKTLNLVTTKDAAGSNQLWTKQ